MVTSVESDFDHCSTTEFSVQRKTREQPSEYGIDMMLIKRHNYWTVVPVGFHYL